VSLVCDPDLGELCSEVVVSMALGLLEGVLACWTHGVGELGTGVGSVSLLAIAVVVDWGDWALIVRVGGRER